MDRTHGLTRYLQMHPHLLQPCCRPGTRARAGWRPCRERPGSQGLRETWARLAAQWGTALARQGVLAVARGAEMPLRETCHLLLPAVEAWPRHAAATGGAPSRHGWTGAARQPLRARYAWRRAPFATHRAPLASAAAEREARLRAILLSALRVARLRLGRRMVEAAVRQGHSRRTVGWRGSPRGTAAWAAPRVAMRIAAARA
mmetsp:Transcript_68719/g.222014  ORF Transcript_68719/g.222014 Transcript_68719/m.222014 type:complete len:202 (-) Transcript_68719:141-746(-)